MSKIETEKSAENYLDVGDNVHVNVIGWLEITCGENKQWFIPGVCQDKGHRYAKVIVCGKEWCAICGKRSSMANNRRYVRWLTKIMQFESMRYYVFTIPEELRYRYKTKEALTELGRRAQEMMKRHGHDRGLRRWHWFGDKTNKWNPHLNILVEGKYTDEKELKSIKRGWARIIGAEVVSVNVSYKSTPRDMAGCLQYVTRATFLDYNWDIDMAMELRGFRNMVVWGKGKWDNEPVWELSPVERQSKAGEDLDVKAIENIIEHKCPRCGSLIVWSSALPAKILELQDKVSYGAGYYGINERGRPPELSDDIKRHLERIRMEWRVRVLLSDKNIKRLDGVLYHYLN
jgi:hypothetical protein